MAQIILISGAHGTGKTTLVQALAGQIPGCVLFDMDTILDDASMLANRNIRTRPESWPTYNNLWLSILKTVCDNGLTPVLFSPAHPEEIETPDWCAQMEWIGLDCAEPELRERLKAREWEPDKIDEAVDDLMHTREELVDIVDASGLSVSDVCLRLSKLIEGKLNPGA